MKRRAFLAGGCAVALAPVAGAAVVSDESEMPPIEDLVHLEKRRTYKDLYWEAQAQINALEEEVAELRAHALTMRAGRENSRA